MAESEDTIAALQKQNPEFNVEQFGSASTDESLNEMFSVRPRQGGELSLPLTLLILAVALGGLVAAGVPLLLALTGVLATMALVAIPSQVFPLDSNVGPLILLIGLAVGVDYSLFYMRREREERASGKSPQESLLAAAATSGRAVMISGITVMIAMSGMFITGEATFESFAVATVSVVAVEMFVSLLVLPAVLAWLGDRIEKGRIPFTRRLRRPAGESRLWSGIVRRVMRRPVLSAALAAGLPDRPGDPGPEHDHDPVGPGRHPAGPADHEDVRQVHGRVPRQGQRQRGRRPGRRRSQRRGRRRDRRAGREGRRVGHVHRSRRHHLQR